MADVAESDTAKVVVKKEVEENPESPDHVDVQDSPTSQADTNGGQKLTKVWSDNETRSMLEFHKSFMEKHDDGNYSKKQLLEDVAQELNVRGFDITPEKVRNKMKYLRARYKRMLEYNAKHAVKKTTPFQEELAELYNMPFFEDEPVVDVNGLNESVASSKSVRVKKKPKNHSASRVSLKSVLAAKKKGNAATKASKIIKKKAKARRTVHPLFQCGLCMDKFHSSSEMHGHSCNSTPVKVNHENKKKIVSRSPARAFHWNGLITVQFLETLKECQEKDKSFNIRKGYIWENISQRMKQLGYKIPAEELSKKWNLLSASYEKAVAYNNTHRDKKKCAFFKRLMELHNHKPTNGLKQRNVSAKRTVEVSPFSFKRGPSSSTLSSNQPSSSFTGQMIKEEMTKQANTPELVAWFNNTWTEYKEMERRRQNDERQRHNEIMEMLSYLVESRNLHY